METRTSHSSPCFLRVAEASAASSAPKMISLSTLFSFETASTTSKISLFMIYLPSLQRRQSRPADFREPYAHGEIVHVHLDVLAVGLAQHARVALAPVARHLQFDLHAVVHEAREVFRRSQHPVESRRRNFERICARKRIVRIEQFRDQ